jgi:hypothetical protein
VQLKLSQRTTIIAPEKLRDYILNLSNPDGESKARFLKEMGYEQENWKTLESDLRKQHLSEDTIPGKQSVYGAKSEIFAPLIGPNGEKRWLRSVWMIRKGESIARFITLIPEKKP